MPPNAKRLELDQDDRFNQREWRVQHVAWSTWVLVLVAGLVGLLGSGPLSHASAKSETGKSVVFYDRFVHYCCLVNLGVNLAHLPSERRRVRLKLSRDFLDRVEIQRIHPEPVHSELADDGAIFVFDRAPNTRQSRIVIYFEYQEYGLTRGRIELEGNETVSFSQFVFP